MVPKELSKEEEYIISESPEINLGENIGWVKKLSGLFPALQSQNYRRYFYGNLVSLVGTWLQTVAQGWLVLKLTDSAFLVGVVAAASTLPTLFIAPFGGVIIDRLKKQHILYFTQAVQLVLALALGILTILNIVTIGEILFLSFLLGVVTAIDSPARQAYVVDLVDREQLTSAIALNSGVYNAARVIGPSVAGLLIALVGTGGAFMLNGVSFFAVIIALMFIRVKEILPDVHPRPIQAIKEGISYSYKHPIIRALMVFTGIISIFGWSYVTILPVMAQNIYHAGAAGLGYLYAASGLGALTAAVLVSALSKKIPSTFFIIGGSFIFAFSLIGFSFTHRLETAYPFLFLVGFGLLAQFSMMNTIIQQLVKDKFRGRISSIYTLMFIGLAPFGSFEIGWVADQFRSPFAIQLSGVITILATLLLMSRMKKIREAYDRYKKEKDD